MPPRTTGSGSWPGEAVMGDSADAAAPSKTTGPVQFIDLLFRTSSHDGGLFAQFTTSTPVNLPKGTEIYYSRNGLENSYPLGTISDIQNTKTINWIFKPSDPKHEYCQEFIKRVFIEGKVVNFTFDYTDSEQASADSINLEPIKKLKGLFHGRKTSLVSRADVDLRVGSIQAMVVFRNPLNVDISISEIDTGVFFNGSDTRIATVKRDEGYIFELPPSQEVTKTLKLRLEHYFSLLKALHRTEVDIKIYSLVITISDYRFPLLSISQGKVPFKAEVYGAIPISGLF